MIVALEDARDADTFGGKATQLGTAIRAGLPVPPGFAVSVDALAAIRQDDATQLAAVEQVLLTLRGAVAARSSAIGEDSGGASFAGQHVTVLNLATAGAAIEGLKAVYESAHSPGALAYRTKKAIAGPIRIAAVLQKLVDPLCAGVMFTRHPVTGADEFVIEAAWGLGEAVVQGIVTPDHFRVARDGAVLEERAGDKPIAVRCTEDGTTEVEVPADMVEKSCLSHQHLAQLHDLGLRCEATFGANLDLEWAIADGELYLLQSRPITTR